MYIFSHKTEQSTWRLFPLVQKLCRASEPSQQLTVLADGSPHALITQTEGNNDPYFKQESLSITELLGLMLQGHLQMAHVALLPVD